MLADERCVPVTKLATRLAAAQCEDLLSQVPAWQLQTRDGVQCLERQFRFADFAGALAFANRLGELADAQDHHPAILVEWGRATVGWWTHVVSGIAPQRLRHGCANRSGLRRVILMARRRAAAFRHGVCELIQTNQRIAPADARIRHALAVS